MKPMDALVASIRSSRQSREAHLIPIAPPGHGCAWTLQEQADPARTRQSAVLGIMKPHPHVWVSRKLRQAMGATLLSQYGGSGARRTSSPVSASTVTTY
jgi:hypothetical protein